MDLAQRCVHCCARRPTRQFVIASHAIDEMDLWAGADVARDQTTVVTRDQIAVRHPRYARHVHVVGAQVCSGSGPRAARPPSMGRTVPLMKLAWSESR
jgi:hypothetical protein